jgi:hypothetical protein
MITTLPNLDRLIEDLNATLPLFDNRAARGRPVHPTAATLELLGERFIDGAWGDERAAWLRVHPWVLRPLVTRPSLRILFGTVGLSYFLAGIVYARRDMHGEFIRNNEWDWEATLQWLVLRGIEAHQLWVYLPSSLIKELLRPSLRRDGLLLSPLQLCVLRECPGLARDLPRADQSEFERSFEAWMVAEGTDRFNLFWLRTLKQLSTRAVGGRDGGVRPRSAPSLPPNLIWPDQEPTSASPLPTANDRKEYGAFGADFPVVRVACEIERGLMSGIWRGFVQAGYDGAVELAGSRVGLQLPTSWLPASVLLLEMTVSEALDGLVWVQVLLEGRVVDVRPGSAYKKGRPVKVLIQTAARSAAPMLEFQFACLPEAFAVVARSGGVFARLHGVEFWRLR